MRTHAHPIAVFKQLTRPAEYFRDVLRGRDYARGQFGVFK